MNSGYCWALDLQRSDPGRGIAIFNYTDLPDFNVDDPLLRYPISLTITHDTVKFIVHYCGMHSKRLLQDNNTDKHNIYHVEKTLIELPFSKGKDELLTTALKRLYVTQFPLSKSESGLDYYMAQLILDHYSRDISNESDYNIRYSSLRVWGIYDRSSESRRRHSDNDLFRKVIRKLFLDFLFDLVHCDVFQNSAYYHTMYDSLMSNFFFSAIAYKSEFYYQRALVNDFYKRKKWTYCSDMQNGINASTMYAHCLELAEKNWVNCIQSAESDRYFVHIPKWFDDSIERENTDERNCNIVFPKFRIEKNYWFVKPEEELRRVYFDLRDNNDRICCSNDFMNLMRPEWQCIKNKTPDQERILERKRVSSIWLLKRYDFADAFRLISFPGGNMLYIICLLLFILCVICPCGLISVAPFTLFVPFVLILVCSIPQYVYYTYISQLCVSSCYNNQCAKSFRYIYAYRSAKSGRWIAGSIIMIGMIFIMRLERHCLVYFLLLVLLIVFIVLIKRLRKPVVQWRHCNSCCNTECNPEDLPSWTNIAVIFVVLLAVLLCGCFTSIPMWFLIICVILWRQCVNLCFDFPMHKYAHFILPKLIASITAAWLTIAFSNDLYKAFFDMQFSWNVILIVGILVFIYVLYNINRTVPLISAFRKFARAVELLIISFAMSLVVGLVVINFSGERMLERSGIFPAFYRHNVLLAHSHEDGAGYFLLDSTIFNPDSIKERALMCKYTYDLGKEADSNRIRKAIHYFASEPFGNHYVDKIVHMLDTLARDTQSCACPKLPCETYRNFLLHHENDKLFVDYLPHVKFYKNDSLHGVQKGTPIVRTINIGLLDDYRMFILHDFLIQFACIAMFIGIFVHMIFEGKGLAES